MSDLVSMRSNLSYVKKEGEYLKIFEVIFLRAKPKYKVSTSLEMVKDTEIEDFRVKLTEEDVNSLIEYLEQVKNLTEEDYKNK